MTEVIGNVTAAIAAAGYVSALKIQVPPHITNLLIHIVENNVQSVYYKILGQTRAGGEEQVLKAQTLIAQDGSTWETLSDPWLYVDVQILDGAGHGSVNIDITGN